MSNNNNMEKKIVEFKKIDTRKQAPKIGYKLFCFASELENKKNKTLSEERRIGGYMSALAKSILSICLISAMTGCMVMAGTPQALRTHYEGLNGLVATGKEMPSQPKTYFTYQTVSQTEETKRALAPGFFGELFGK